MSVRKGRSTCDIDEVINLEVITYHDWRGKVILSQLPTPGHSSDSFYQGTQFKHSKCITWTNSVQSMGLDSIQGLPILLTEFKFLVWRNNSE